MDIKGVSQVKLKRIHSPIYVCSFSPQFDLLQTIQVKTGDLLGFWTAGSESVITR